MSESTRQCMGMDDITDYEEELDAWEDPHAPEFVRCRFVPQPDKSLCLKHQFIVDSGHEVKMYEAVGDEDL